MNRITYAQSLQIRRPVITGMYNNRPNVYWVYADSVDYIQGLISRLPAPRQYWHWKYTLTGELNLYIINQSI
jgi:hypothetical protein